MKTAILFLTISVAFGQSKPGTCKTQEQQNPDVLDIHMDYEVSKGMIRTEVTPEEMQPGLMKKLRKIPGMANVWFDRKVITILKDSAQKDEQNPKIWKGLLRTALKLISLETSRAYDSCAELPKANKPWEIISQ